MEENQLTQEMRERLLVLYGYLQGLHNKPIGKGLFDSVERLYIPDEVRKPLEDLLFPPIVVKGGNA